MHGDQEIFRQAGTWPIAEGREKEEEAARIHPLSGACVRSPGQ